MIWNHIKPVSLKPGFVLLLVVAISIVMVQAEAVSMGKITVAGPKVEANKGYAIGIILSKSCIALVKAGKDTCPSYKDLASIDNSIPEYSGPFAETNGYYHRVPPKFANNMGYYQYDPTFRVFVDPPQTARMPLITIETKIPEYHISGQFKINEIKDYTLKDSKATKSARSYSHTRYVDSTCSFASITAVNWKTVLPDTIHFMRSNCDPKQTQIDTITLDVKQLTKHDIATSSKYKLDQFYLDVIKNCTKSYGACKTVDNRQVTTTSDRK